MNQETVDALDRFFSAQKKLNELGIIRSRDYIGDVARYLCREVYNLELSKGRRTGHDGTIDAAHTPKDNDNKSLEHPIPTDLGRQIIFGCQ